MWNIFIVYFVSLINIYEIIFTSYYSFRVLYGLSFISILCPVIPTNFQRDRLLYRFWMPGLVFLFVEKFSFLFFLLFSLFLRWFLDFLGENFMPTGFFFKKVFNFIINVTLVCNTCIIYPPRYHCSIYVSTHTYMAKWPKTRL